ncbi:hypothetical protein GOODEAATRI_009494 [Goodea atripinnis]|uniref:Mitochondrial import inner membrane translocase subunit TIM50 n=1 Tax=Goodea atripinnis TaxID=208336 RepID=A0ABV0PCQ8_9TELE
MRDAHQCSGTGFEDFEGSCVSFPVKASLSVFTEQARGQSCSSVVTKVPDLSPQLSEVSLLPEVYVLKRPYVDEFLRRMGEMFECVLFTASLAKVPKQILNLIMTFFTCQQVKCCYADPVTDLLDQGSVFRTRLFRESCVFHQGCYVKDLSRLGRDLNRTLILDNSPASYIFHPNNAIPVASWFDDADDAELFNLLPVFEELSKADNVYTRLDQLREQ